MCLKELAAREVVLEFGHNRFKMLAARQQRKTNPEEDFVAERNMSASGTKREKRTGQII